MLGRVLMVRTPTFHDAFTVPFLGRAIGGQARSGLRHARCQPWHLRAARAPDRARVRLVDFDFDADRARCTAAGSGRGAAVARRKLRSEAIDRAAYDRSCERTVHDEVAVQRACAERRGARGRCLWLQPRRGGSNADAAQAAVVFGAGLGVRGRLAVRRVRCVRRARFHRCALCDRQRAGFDVEQRIALAIVVDLVALGGGTRRLARDCPAHRRRGCAPRAGASCGQRLRGLGLRDGRRDRCRRRAALITAGVQRQPPAPRVEVAGPASGSPSWRRPAHRCSPPVRGSAKATPVRSAPTPPPRSSARIGRARESEPARVASSTTRSSARSDVRAESYSDSAGACACPVPACAADGGGGGLLNNPIGAPRSDPSAARSAATGSCIPGAGACAAANGGGRIGVRRTSRGASDVGRSSKLVLRVVLRRRRKAPSTGGSTRGRTPDALEPVFTRSSASASSAMLA